MNSASETPHSAVLKQSVKDMRSSTYEVLNTIDELKRLAADLDAQERLMGELIAGIRKIASCECHHPDDVVGIARALLARIEVSKSDANG